MENEDTVALLKECIAGCKMATNSIEQVLSYCKSQELSDILHKFNKRHVDLGDSCHTKLEDAGEREKDPNPMAETFSKISTTAKMLMDTEDKKIAEIMVDGCNMGIKSLAEYLNKYKAASEDSRTLVGRLIKLEEEFQQEMLHFL